MKYGNRPLIKKIASSPITIVGLLIVIFFLARAAWNVYAKSHAAEVKLSQAQIEMEKLKERKDNLSARIDYISTPEGVEAEMRTKYRAVKKGESVAVIIEDQQPAAVGNISATSTAQVNWFGKFLRLLGFGR